MLWHPFLVAYCWYLLYGFPWSPKLWACFFLHDVGYFGRENMDGTGYKGGQWHPYLGANLIYKLFGIEWGIFCLFHSRAIVSTAPLDDYNKIFVCFKRAKFVGKSVDAAISKLCVADKLAVKYSPIWLFNKDELAEYMEALEIVDKKDFKPLMIQWADEFVSKYKDIAYDVTEY